LNRLFEVGEVAIGVIAELNPPGHTCGRSLQD
jgi:hypothetical protein